MGGLGCAHPRPGLAPTPHKPSEDLAPSPSPRASAQVSALQEVSALDSSRRSRGDLRLRAPRSPRPLRPSLPPPAPGWAEPSSLRPPGGARTPEGGGQGAREGTPSPCPGQRDPRSPGPPPAPRPPPPPQRLAPRCQPRAPPPTREGLICSQSRVINDRYLPNERTLIRAQGPGSCGGRPRSLPSPLRGAGEGGRVSGPRPSQPGVGPILRGPGASGAGSPPPPGLARAALH